jgi:hypothetical protein
MKRMIVATCVASAFAFIGVPVMDPAAAAAPHANMETYAASRATDLSARRQTRRIFRESYQFTSYPYRQQPYYYGRPTYYRPYPYVLPAPFPFGIGFDPVW